MPQKDAKRLEYLFRELIVYNAAGYTLLGNKPVSFEGFIEPHFEWDFLFLWHTFIPSNLKRYRAWQTWQKYAHLFNQGDVLIWAEPSPWVKHGQLIVLMSQQQLKRVLQENQEDFASLQTKEPKMLFSEALRSHDGLLGILLGYGRKNSWLFYNHNHVLLKPVFSDEINQIFNNKIAALNFTFGWPNVAMRDILMFPSFMADTDAEETGRLKSEYLHTRKDILNYYEGKDFLRATLQLLNRQEGGRDNFTRTQIAAAKIIAAKTMLKLIAL